MQRYFGEIFEGRAILCEDDVFHLIKVMRGRVATEIEVVSNGKVYLCHIEKMKPLIIRVQGEISEDRELKSDVILIMAPIKGDKTALVLQKATELGVREVVLLHTSRTVVNFNHRDLIDKLSRFRKILKEAAEQSQRIHIPTISYLDDIAKLASIRADHKLIAYEQQSGPTSGLNKILKSLKKQERIAIVIGPEGGFAPEEIEVAKSCQYIPVSLGHRILRAETASIYALCVIANALEN
ncbi:MAG: RsmE family RNA methyltransferase [Bacilli bacterium]|jgi:16S rRNA (uracil1498-N3)-methyltransferase